MSTSKKRESYIEKRITITAGIGDFSSVSASAAFGETIEWDTSAERQKKINNLTKALHQDLQKDFNDFLKAHDLRHRSTLLVKRANKAVYDEDEPIDMD